MALKMGSLDVSYGSDDNPLPSLETVGLRERLLREAREERSRCLHVARASERDKAASPFAPMVDSATQTEPAIIFATGDVDPMVATDWDQSDEDAQAESIRAIQALGERQSSVSSSHQREQELEQLLLNERARVMELEAALARDITAREAIERQVILLESEMDGKEANLQASQKLLEQRSRVQLHGKVGFRQRSPSASPYLCDSPPLALAGGGHLDTSLPGSLQVLRRSSSAMRYTSGNVAAPSHLERTLKMDAKDQKISKLLRELRQCPDISPATRIDKENYKVIGA